MPVNAFWPTALPQLLVEAYSETMGKESIRTQMDAGPAKMRKRFTAAPRPLASKILLPVSDVPLFEGFYYETLQGGSLPFDWYVLRNGLSTGLTDFGAAIRFAAANQYVLTPTVFPAQSGAFTIEFKFKARDFNAPQGLLMQFGAFEAYKLINGEIAFYVRSDSGSQIKFQNFAGIPDNEWHTWSWAVDVTSSIVYLDGAAVSTSSPLNNHTITTATQTTLLGKVQEGSDFYYADGLMDEVRFWTTKRAQVDIQATLDAELVGDESGLWSYYKFNEYDGITAADGTANKRDAVLYNVTRIPTVATFRITEEPTIVPADGSDLNWFVEMKLEVMPS